jgi:hypothetical protein
MGEVLGEAGGGEASIEVVLDRDDLRATRRTNPSLANRRL